MLQIDDLVFNAWGRRFFDRASVTLPANGKVGLVGRNGVGKSTLFKLVLGELMPDRGEIGLDRPAFFRASECFDAIGWDLEKAVRRIEIFCPFLNEVSVHHWLARLRRPLARGVQVTVHTREPSKPYQRGLYEQLEHAGCRMVRRPAMHEKVVIVDDVLWHGSMNVLGYGRSTDLMVRMTSRVLCEQVIRMVAETRPDSPPPPRRVRLQGMSQAGAGDTCPRCHRAPDPAGVRADRLPQRARPPAGNR